jgi:hypothetical protein
MCPTKKIEAQVKISSIVSGKIDRQTSRGNKHSGIWSRPVTRLLGAKLKRRFIKLENKSPAIAILPMRVPVTAAKPSKGATAVVNATETSTPRLVFAGPNSGRRSKNKRSPTIGCENRLPKAFFARTGAPFAMVNKTINFVSKTSCTKQTFLLRGEQKFGEPPLRNPACHSQGCARSHQGRRHIPRPLAWSSFRTAARRGCAQIATWEFWASSAVPG